VSGLKFHHVKANSGGRTSFVGRAFEVTNSAGQSWVSAVTNQHVLETSGVKLTLQQPNQVPQAPTQATNQQAPPGNAATLRVLWGISGAILLLGCVAGIGYLGHAMAKELQQRQEILS